jgi:hypothetical protein
MWHPDRAASRGARDAAAGGDEGDEGEGEGEGELLDDTVEDGAVTAADTHHAREVQFQLGALYDALLGGGGFLEPAGAGAAAGAAAESLLAFGVCISRMGLGGAPSSPACGEYSVKSARAALHILKENGETLRMGAGSASLGRQALSSKSIVALALPVGCSLVESDQVRQDVVAALPGLAAGRGELVLVDSMTAAAVEFVDGWYSNIYDSASMQLVLVHMHAHCVQVGMAIVGPSYVDVIHVVETELCSERRLYEQVAALLGERIQQAVSHTYNWAPAEGSSWFPNGLAELESLAPRIISEIGSKGESHIAYPYCPQGIDCVMMLDVCIGAHDLVASAAGDAAETSMSAVVSAASQLMQELSDKDPAKFGKAGEGGSVLRGVAPIGPSCAGELLCKTLLSVVGAQKDNIHFFLRDPRNLAAGAARAALWFADGNSSKSVEGGETAGEAAGGEEAGEGKKEVRNVVRRCAVSYMCSVRVSDLPTTGGEPERSPSPVTIPWNPRGNALPANCAVNDLEDTNVGLQTFVISDARSGLIYASIPLADSDEVSVTIDTNGLLDAKRFYQGTPLNADVCLARHPCRFLAHGGKATGGEDVEDGAEHETELGMLLSSLAPVLSK